MLYIDKCWTLTELKTAEAEREVVFNEDLYVYLTILYEKRIKEKEEMGTAYRDTEKVRVYTEDGGLGI